MVRKYVCIIGQSWIYPIPLTPDNMYPTPLFSRNHVPHTPHTNYPICLYSQNCVPHTPVLWIPHTPCTAWIYLCVKRGRGLFREINFYIQSYLDVKFAYTVCMYVIFRTAATQNIAMPCTGSCSLVCGYGGDFSKAQKRIEVECNFHHQWLYFLGSDPWFIVYSSHAFYPL